MKKNPYQELFKALAWSCLISILLTTFLFAEAEKAQSPGLTPPKKECPDDKASTSKPDPSLPSETPQSQEKSGDRLLPVFPPMKIQPGTDDKG